MQPKQALLTILRGTIGVTNIVGSRIYHDVAPENVVHPYVVFEQTGGRTLKTLAGTAALKSLTFTITAVGQNSADVDAVRQAVCNLEGPDPTGAFRWIFQEDEQDGYTNPAEGQERGNRRAAVDLTLWV
jgi:hypothetical protein